MSHLIHVVGLGPIFDRHYGAALLDAGIRLADDPEAAEAVVFSTLDGAGIDIDPPRGKPSILITGLDTTLHRPAGCTSHIDDDLSAERLLAELGSLIFAEASRRRAPRQAAAVSIRYTVAGGDPLIVTAETFNLSLGGAFVRTLRALSVGDRVTIEIDTGDDARLHLTGTVVHSVVIDLEHNIVRGDDPDGAPITSHPGFAVSFDELSSEQVTRLESYLEAIGR